MPASSLPVETFACLGRLSRINFVVGNRIEEALNGSIVAYGDKALQSLQAHESNIAPEHCNGSETD